jgi:hypothetical protein
LRVDKCGKWAKLDVAKLMEENLEKENSLRQTKKQDVTK